ncbi:hypothetical protein [Rhizobium sp. Leaf341]|uniref:hypothetical protein n=1 Tax=Rhizobium sp. Leaf341 TaxID=1736344 RepID=UPI00071295A9|nr:hypothetical protein [Rhizobium sp. Leaf341]KQR67859.1 hypothetical protein ASG03_10085 [Rhizobium sp. Leaf341]
MAVDTPAAFACSASAWTLVASAKTSVLIQSRTMGGFRVFVGSAAPAVTAETYFSVSSKEGSLAINGMTGTENVYVLGDVTVEVLRG